MDECNGFCLTCERYCPNESYEQCVHCGELVNVDEISRYFDSNEDETGQWVCDACVKRGAFNEDEQMEAA